MSISAERSQSEQVFRDNSTSRNINNLLNSHKTRLEGLKQLNSFLPQCPGEDFRQFCVSWMQNCCKTDGFTKNRNYTVHLLCDLLKTSSNYPELKKTVSFFITTRYFDFFFKYLLNSEAGWTCTETCLCLYRGACGPFQDNLEKHLAIELEKNVRISNSKAQCFALLPSTGGGGNDGVNWKKNWKGQFVNLLSSCNSVLSDLFCDVEDCKLQECEAQDSSSNTNGGERNIEHLAMQFQNYCRVLGFMLLNEYPALKSIPSDLTFQLICRGLAVNPKTLGRRQTTDVSTLQKVLPEIHRALLSLLKAVIVTCKNQLLPYSHLICKLIKQSLQWTESDFTYGNGKTFGSLRISVYETLCNWLAFARSGSCIETISDAVVSNAINDMTSKKGVVFLKGSRSQNQWKGREETVQQTDLTVDGKLFRAALKALQFLLRFAGALLKAEVHKFLQEVVVKSLIGIQKSSAPDLMVPFDVPACRTELYSLLLELTHQPSPKWPPPTNFALALFTGGLNDGSPEVSSFCSAALNQAAIIIHPQYDNGGFPFRDPPDRDSRIRTGEGPRWTEEPTELVNGKVAGEVSEENGRNKENRSESDETDPLKAGGDANEGSEFSSDEDSRNTVTFSKDAAELSRGALPMDQEREEVLLRGSPAAEGDSNAEGPATAGASLAGEESSRATPDRKRMKKPSESDHAQDSDGPKSISPESPGGDGNLKGRYFLRSKTQGSSEEPEEALRRAGSPDSAKSTPAKTASKMTPSIRSSAKRPRTRALSKAEGHGEAEVKTPGKSGRDDEEDITAAFDDSFVD